MAMAHFSGGPHHAQALLGELGLADRRNHYPAQLSVGEQQRVAIARALAKRPALILADEPTGSLDPIRTRDIVRQLRDACRAHNATLLVVSHEPEVVHAFDRAVDFMDINRAFEPSGTES
jgi:putative ABC transport system ATP-binding protein